MISTFEGLVGQQLTALNLGWEVREGDLILGLGARAGGSDSTGPLGMCWRRGRGWTQLGEVTLLAD